MSEATEIIMQVKSLNPLSAFIAEVIVGEWREIEKKDKDGELTGKKEDRMRVFFELADEDLIVESGDKKPFVSIKRNEKGLPELVHFPFTPVGKTYQTWSPKLQDFYAKGEEYKDFRKLAPMLVAIMIRRGLIK